MYKLTSRSNRLSKIITPLYNSILAVDHVTQRIKAHDYHVIRNKKKIYNVSVSASLDARKNAVGYLSPRAGSCCCSSCPVLAGTGRHCHRRYCCRCRFCCSASSCGPDVRFPPRANPPPYRSGCRLVWIQNNC